MLPPGKLHLADSKFKFNGHLLPFKKRNPNEKKAHQQLRTSQSRQLDGRDSSTERGVGDSLQTPDEDLHVLLAGGLVEVEVSTGALNHLTAISETLINRVLRQSVAMCWSGCC